MQIVTLSEQTEAAYQAFIDALPGRLAFSGLEYRRLLKEYLGANDHYLLALAEDGTVAGALPAFSISGGMGTVVNSLPFYGSNGGVLVDPVHPARHAVRSSLLKAYLALCADLQASAHTIVTSPFESDISFYETAAAWTHRDERIGQISILPGAQEVAQTSVSVTDALMQSYHQKARNGIRKAEKSGITAAEEWSGESLHFLAETHRENIEALGGIAKPAIFFEKLAAAYGSDSTGPGTAVRLFTGRASGKLVAAVLLLYAGPTVEYFCPVVEKSWRSQQPLSLVIREAMAHAIADNRRYWNWGGTWRSQAGVHRFKNHLGAKDYPYYYLTKVANRAILDATRAALLAEYPNFYVVPFSALTPESAAASDSDGGAARTAQEAEPV